MPELVARYEDIDLPVIDVVNGTPLVFFDGRIQPATDVVVGHRRLDDILPAPRPVPLPPGWWADYETHKNKNKTIYSLPLVAFLWHANGWGEPIEMTGDGIQVSWDGPPSSRMRRLGYRFGEPASFRSYGDE